jgi:hypothetical protein
LDAPLVPPSCLQSKKRSERLAILAEAAGSVGRSGVFKFLWSEAGAQPALESALNVGMTPSIVAVSEAKGLFTPYKVRWRPQRIWALVQSFTSPHPLFLQGSFAAKDIKRWVDALTSTRDGATPLPAGSTVSEKVSTVAPWDGKDGVAPADADSEFSLDELDL